MQAQCVARINAEQSFCVTAIGNTSNSCEATCARVAAELRMSETLLNLARGSVLDGYTARERLLSEYPHFVHLRPTLDDWRERALSWWTGERCPVLDAKLRCEGEKISAYLDQCLNACADTSAQVTLSCRALGQTAVATPLARVHLAPPGSFPGSGQ